MTPFKLGLSANAAWAWGVSVGVGFSILETMGVVAFMWWAVANAAALPIFGYFAYRHPEYLHHARHRVVKSAMVVIQIFCVWVNVKIMSSFVGATWATAFTLIAFVLTYKYRFAGAVKRHTWQYVMIIVALLAMIVLGKQDVTLYRQLPLNIAWLVPACLGLIAGPFIDGQQHLHAKMVKTPISWAVAGIAFALYMVLVAVAFISRSPIANALLMIVIVNVATDTLDSSVAALQDLTGDRWAIILSLGALVTWPLFLHKTAVQIWTIYATGRIFVVAPLVISTLWGAGKWKIGKKNDTPWYPD